MYAYYRIFQIFRMEFIPLKYVVFPTMSDACRKSDSGEICAFRIYVALIALVMPYVERGEGGGGEAELIYLS